MTKQEFSLIKAYLSGAYSRFDIDPNVWFDFLKDLNYQIALISVKDYVRGNKFPPTISDIMTIYYKLFDDFHRLPLDATIIQMRNAGYFHSPFAEPEQVIDRRMYQANKWLFTGLAPDWFLRDYKQHKNKQMGGGKIAIS